MKSILKKKTYYLVTHPDLPGRSVENYGDRIFIMRHPNPRVQTISDGILINGDRNWDITEENILQCANMLLEEKLAEVTKEEQKQKEKEAYDKLPFITRWLGIK